MVVLYYPLRGLGVLTRLIIATFDGGDEPALAFFNEAVQGEEEPEYRLVEIFRPPASEYVVLPWFFLLDGTTGQRRQSVCWYHIRS